MKISFVMRQTDTKEKKLKYQEQNKNKYKLKSDYMSFDWNDSNSLVFLTGKGSNLPGMYPSPKQHSSL